MTRKEILAQWSLFKIVISFCLNVFQIFSKGGLIVRIHRTGIKIKTKLQNKFKSTSKKEMNCNGKIF